MKTIIYLFVCILCMYIASAYVVVNMTTPIEYAATGQCASGYVIMNTTKYGVQCVMLPVAGSANLSGSGVTGYLSAWANSTNLNASVVYQSGNRIGIGTITPTYDLDVNGTINIAESVIALRIGGTVAFGKGMGGGDGIRINGGTTNGIDITPANDNTVKIKILPNGNVGIGTTSPGTKLHVLSSSDSVLRIENSGANSNPGIEIKNDAETWTLQTVGARADNFEIYDVGSGATRLAIDQAGNVGIGTTNPPSKLSVTGNASITTAIKANDYYSGDGTQGMTGSCDILSVASITVKDGLITACS